MAETRNAPTADPTPRTRVSDLTQRIIRIPTAPPLEEEQIKRPLQGD